VLPYPIVARAGALDELGEMVRRLAPAHRYAVITDETVAALHAERVTRQLPGDRTIVLTIPAGESSKTRDQWARLSDLLLAAGAGRDTTILALGGGVVGDLAGFVAATFMRGVPYLQLPTTLLAMIDSSIGGKTGVDVPAGKNLVGAFHPPVAVLADLSTLGTLPSKDLRAGMAEAVKHGVVADANYFHEVNIALPALVARDGWRLESMARLVNGSIAIKSAVVRQDEREGGVRKILNFGHTIGHAVESLSDYRLLHGEAIAIGMVAECAIAEQLGLAPSSLRGEVTRALDAAGLPTRVPANLPGITVERVLEATRTDKKARAGVVEYSLPSGVGAMAGRERGYGIPVPDEIVRQAMGVISRVQSPDSVA
jgi:3-dehydroquinate synthase